MNIIKRKKRKEKGLDTGSEHLAITIIHDKSERYSYGYDYSFYMTLTRFLYSHFFHPGL